MDEALDELLQGSGGITVPPWHYKRRETENGIT
jgi:hypothetical protein